MGWLTLTAIYIIVWWVVLFVVLPLGMNQGSQARPEDGGDWGAPQRPNLRRKFITTTWVSAIVWAVLILAIQFQIIPLPDVPVSY